MPEETINRTTARQESGRAYGNWYWASKQKNRDNNAPKPERVAMILEYRKYRKIMETAPPERNDRGNEIYRDEDADSYLNLRRGGDRYYYDFGALGSGWKQYDTSQDASYFGMWVNVEKRMTFTYAEGDRTLVVARTLETFRAELQNAGEFYGEAPPAMIGIDADGTVTRYYDERPAA